MIQQTRESDKRPASSATASGWNPGQFAIALVGLSIVIGLLWLGFLLCVLRGLHAQRAIWRMLDSKDRRTPNSRVFWM